MKGQGARALATSIITVVILILIGFYIQGHVYDATPHDIAYYNESICTTTCTNYTTGNYSLDHPPANIVTPLTGANITCYNATGGAMTYGGYPAGEYWLTTNLRTVVFNDTASNIWQHVNCTYTYDAWSTLGSNPQTWYNSALSNVNASYLLISIVGIAMGALLIVSMILLLGRK